VHFSCATKVLPLSYKKNITIPETNEMNRLRMIWCAIGCILIGGNLSLLIAQDTVSLADRGNYYEVTLDYTTGASHYAMGQQLMKKILTAVPNFEQLMDSYIAELVPDQTTYNIMLGRVADIKPQIPQDYQDEIDGMASRLSGGSVNTRNDGKLSKNELYELELFTDVGRSTQCSGISVYGPRSATGNTMTARVLDWYDGANHQLAQIQAVTTIKNGNMSVCTIGYLSVLGIITGFNDNGVFAGILDSPTGAAYSSSGKRSYIWDLRYALEHDSTAADVGAYMSDPSRSYTYNHLILLSDSHTSKVLENNFSRSGTNIHRALRSDTSSLNPGITWGFSNAVAAVNAFLLAGNCDNYTGILSNTQRWSSIKSQFQLCGDTVSLAELKQIASFDHGVVPQSQSAGNIYNSGTQQIVIFQPDIFHLEIAFKPKSGILPVNPLFEDISVSFVSNPTSVPKSNAVIPVSCMLEQNYPNPFNPSTTISFSVSNKNYVSLRIYNILGQEVADIFEGDLPAGKYTRQWNAGTIPSGVYFCRLTAGASTATKKLILLK